MALSKLAIGLIAGIGSVVTVGGITAGVVVSTQNSTQALENTDSTSDSKAKENKSSDKNDALMSSERRSDSNEARSSVVEMEDHMVQTTPKTEEKPLQQDAKSGAKIDTGQTNQTTRLDDADGAEQTEIKQKEQETTGQSQDHDAEGIGDRQGTSSIPTQPQSASKQTPISTLPAQGNNDISSTDKTAKGDEGEPQDL